MILTVENLNSQKKNCPNTTVSTRNLTCIGLESNPYLRAARPATSRLNNGADLRQRRRQCGDTTCVLEGGICYYEVSSVMPARPCDKRVLEEVK